MPKRLILFSLLFPSAKHPFETTQPQGEEFSRRENKVVFFYPLDSCPWDRLIQRALALIYGFLETRLGKLLIFLQKIVMYGNSVIFSWLPLFFILYSSPTFHFAYGEYVWTWQYSLFNQSLKII